MKPSLAGVVEPVLVGLGCELEDLTVVRAGSRSVVRVTVDGDGADGRGLTLDEVAAASHAVSEALDATDALGDRPYVLEVGTRGVDAPLLKPQHYRRNVGRLVKVSLTSGDVGTHRIVAADDDSVELDGLGRVVFSDIAKAVVQVEMRHMEDEE